MEEENTSYGSITKTAYLSCSSGRETRASSPGFTTISRLSKLQEAPALAPCLPQLWDVSRSPGFRAQKQEVTGKKADVFYGSGLAPALVQ